MANENLQVLIVEDSQDLAELWRIVLTRAGIASVYCSNGADAIAALHADLDPDVLLTDFYLPDMTGTDLTLAAQKLGCRNFLVVTGNVYAAKAAEHAAGTEFLAKPVEKDALVEKIRGFAK